MNFCRIGFYHWPAHYVDYVIRTTWLFETKYSIGRLDFIICAIGFSLFVLAVLSNPDLALLDARRRWGMVATASRPPFSSMVSFYFCYLVLVSGAMAFVCVTLQQCPFRVMLAMPPPTASPIMDNGMIRFHKLHKRRVRRPNRASSETEKS